MNTDKPVVGRLAPTPSGHLHLGNVLAFAAAWLSVRAQNGKLLLRIEDIDHTRSRPFIADMQRRELEWLGLTWDEEVPAQQERDYAPTLAQLHPLTYQCICTRAQIKASGGIYRGICRTQQHQDGAVRFRLESGQEHFEDRHFGPRSVDPSAVGDPVLRRRDQVISYNLAVVADDIRDGVTEVVRGADLLDFTAVQIRLYSALKAHQPTWMHTPLVLGANLKKLSKSHASLHLKQLQDAHWKPHHIWNLVLPWLGVHKIDSIQEAIPLFRTSLVSPGPLICHLEPDTVPTPEVGITWSHAPGAS